MKIALFHNLPPGGAKRVVFEHARRLSERGHVLDAYTTTAADETYLPLAPVVHHLHVYDAPPPPARKPLLRRVAGTTLMRRATGDVARKVVDSLVGFGEAMRALDAWEALYARMARDIDARGYDLAYVHNCRVLQSPHLLRRLAATPSLYFCQDTLRYAHEWALDTPPGYDNNGPAGRGRVRFQGHLFSRTTLQTWQEQARRDARNARGATQIVVNSLYSREAMLREYGVNAQVCYPGVDAAFYCPDPAVTRDKRLVLAVGSISPHKCYDFLIEAIATIPPARRPVLRILGYDLHAADGAPSPRRAALEALAKTKNVTLCVTIDVSDEAIRDGYRQAGAVAFAPHLEPFGFIALEATACGAPFVGVAEAGLRESIQNNETGLLTKRDPEAFGTALDQVLCDQALAAGLGERGRRAVLQHWTWGRSVDTLEQCFARVAVAKDSLG